MIEKYRIVKQLYLTLMDNQGSQDYIIDPDPKKYLIVTTNEVYYVNSNGDLYDTYNPSDLVKQWEKEGKVEHIVEE
jgi:hypothetical protein